MVVNPLAFLRRALSLCKSIISRGCNIQEPVRKQLARDLQSVCSNCISAHSEFVTQISTVTCVLDDPFQLADKAEAFATNRKLRTAFKPDRLCGVVVNLLVRIRSNLDPLKYSVDLGRISDLEKQLTEFNSLDNSLYQQFDSFNAKLRKDLIDLRFAMLHHEQAQDCSTIQTLQVHTSSCLRAPQLRRSF